MSAFHTAVLLVQLERLDERSMQWLN